MPRRLLSTGSPFERQGGYSRAVVDGDLCFVAGTTGYDYVNHVDAGRRGRAGPQRLWHH